MTFSSAAAAAAAVAVAAAGHAEVGPSPEAWKNQASAHFLP